MNSKPRLLIIQATGYQARDVRIPYRIRKRKLVGAVMPYLAALAPKDWEVELHDDAIHEVPFDGNYHVVAIAVRTITSLRAYEIAARFRARKIPVLMGGPHATFYSEEMAEHADAVCIGEGEELFPQMLEDASAGRLRKFYRRSLPADLSKMPTPRWELVNMSHYVFYRPFVILHSRSCPFTCDFCAERRLWGDHGYQIRPAAAVVEDVKRCGSRHIFFAASQFAGNREKSMELMEALIPLKIRWSTLFSPQYCLDKNFIDLAHRSGLLHVNMGIESIDQTTLKSMNKSFNKVREYEAMLDNLHQRDISYSLNFVFGTDGDTPGVFPATLRFLQEHKVQAAYFNIMLPLRGTPLYERMKADGRIMDEQNMERWPGIFCHFKPVHLSPQELVSNVKKIRRDFYSLRSLLRRLPFPVSQSKCASWNVNVLQMKVAAHLDTTRDFSEF